ncbi:MAG: hypothetical protein HQM03_13555 [Magnetococcales bacterium]|nr:hypothetical protein [Magnetococcales bacterium]
MVGSKGKALGFQRALSKAFFRAPFARKKAQRASNHSVCTSAPWQTLFLGFSRFLRKTKEEGLCIARRAGALCWFSFRFQKAETKREPAKAARGAFFAQKAREKSFLRRAR